MVENLNLTTSTTASLQTSTSTTTFKNCPLTAASTQTLRKLSNFLNAKKLFHTDEGYERDWRGLATLAEQRNLLDEIAISGDDPTAKVIQLWCTNNADTATFENLEKFLGIMDRWHIIEDIEENVLQDLRDYQIKQQQQQELVVENENLSISFNDNTENNTFVLPTPPRTPNDENMPLSAMDQLNIPQSIINNTLTNPPPAPPPPPPCSTINEYVVTTSSSTYGGDSNFLTSQDVRRTKLGLPLQHYDALVLYADADYEYAREILNKLQNNFNFCLKEHLLYGIQFEHDALMTLIRDRCTFLIVVLTNEFNKSPENRFFLNYAQFLQIQTARRKILPLRYEMNVEIPANLRMYTSGIAYNQKRKQIFWDKLAESLECANMTIQGEVTYPESIGSSNIAPLPSAPILVNEFRQPPYNPQYKLKYWNSHDSATESTTFCSSSSSSSSNDRSTPHGRKQTIQGEESPGLQSNLYPYTTTLDELMRGNSNQYHNQHKHQMFNTQSDVYPNLSESSDIHRNRITNSKGITATSSLSISTNNTQSEEEAHSSSDQKTRKNNKGPSKFFKKLFRKL